ncbi:hypothetical protein P7C71_g1937, partial [Lecanoromycetidae sp. Uapishka_2]
MTIPTDPDAAIARGPTANEDNEQPLATKGAQSAQPYSQGSAEKTIPTDTDAAVARGTPADDKKKTDERERTKGSNDACEDCT